MHPTKESRALNKACGNCTKLKAAIIKEAPDEVIHKLIEIIYNVLKGVVPLSIHQKKILKRSKNTLRQLVKPKISKKRRRVLLQKEVKTSLPVVLKQAQKVQQGGIISLLPLLSMLL